ncbi:MAG: HEAT repeat domain-containing protein [Planctomycetes bacterium]|nr:HEAT repeat domain-containing protein [Planctomycetota bacterium]
MVWSNWKGALLILLAGVGLAWSQVPTSRPMPVGERIANERIMTVHENGKALRCRVMTTWRTQDGKTAYQLQVVDTGEMMTIEEDGQPTMVSSNQSNVRAMPMRIYRWGKSQTPPPGVPVPPQVVTASNNVASNNVVAASNNVVTTSNKMTSNNMTSKNVVTPVNSTVVSSCDSCQPAGNCNGKEQVVWWEEKNGQRVSPVIVTSGKNPFEVPTVVRMPGNSPEIIVEQPVGRPGMPVVLDCNNQPCVAAKPKLGERLAGLFQKPATVKYGADATMTADNCDPSKPGKTLTNADLAASDRGPASAKKEASGLWAFTKDTKTLPPGKSGVEPVKNVEIAKNDATAKKPGDILLSPEKFDGSEKKLNSKTITMPPAAEPNPLMSTSPTAQNGNLPGLPSGQPLIMPDGKVPLGARSVIAANGGAPAQIIYVPVPMRTQPEPMRPPMPVMKAPDLQQLTANMNAFTPPQQHMPPVGIQPNLPMMAQGNPMQAGPMMPMMQTPQRPVSQVNFQYQGPMPPNPFQGQVQQAIYPQQAPAAAMQYNPAMDRRSAPQSAPQQQSQLPMTNPVDLAHYFQVLKESPYPAQREWAANNLSTIDVRQHPEVVAILLDCAKQDPAATVRAGCVYNLSRLGVANEPIVNTLNMLRQDSDARVRQEVDQALQRMGFNKQ